MEEPPTPPTTQSIHQYLDGVGTEPVTTTEVASTLDISRRTTYNHLERLVEDDHLETKKVGSSARVWWRTDETRELTGEEVLELEFHATDLARSYLDATRGSDVYVGVDSVVVPEDGRALLYMTGSGISEERFLDLLESLPTVTSVRLLRTTDEGVRVEAQLTDDSVSATFREFGGQLRSIEIRDGEFRLVGTVDASVDPETVRSTLGGLYEDVELVARRLVYTPRLFRDVAAAAMTDRQFTVLEAAYHGGYYEDPRQSTGAELAESLGVAKQTVHHHLRRAESAVFDQLFAADASAAV